MRETAKKWRRREVFADGYVDSPTAVPKLIEHGRPLATDEEHRHMEVVRDALEALDYEQQLLLFDYFYERLSYREMARRYGWAAHETARRKVKEALAILRVQLKERGLDDETIGQATRRPSH